MSEPRYGAKCGRCAHIRHDGEHAAEPAPWLQMGPMECADCDTCQSNAIYRMALLGDLFGVEVRDAVHAFHAGTDHPLLDQLKAECEAIEAETHNGGPT